MRKQGLADRANRLLGLEPQREVALALVPLGRNSAIGYAPGLTPLALETTPLSRSEVDYEAIRAMHEASSLTEGAEVRPGEAQRLCLRLLRLRVRCSHLGR